MHFSELIFSIPQLFTAGSHIPAALLWSKPACQRSFTSSQQVLLVLYARGTPPDQIHVITCDPCMIVLLYNGPTILAFTR